MVLFQSTQTVNPAELDFISHYLRDLAAGSIGLLEDYQAIWPDHAEAIEKAYTRLQSEQPVQADPNEGGEFGPYSNLLEIGRGGQGVVYKAEDTRLRRTVALKVLKGLGPGSEHLVQRFKREAEIAAKLDHPGICGVLDAGIINGTPFMAMQFVEGESLSRRVTTAKAAGASEITTSVPGSGDDAPPVKASEVSADSSSSSSGPSDRQSIMRVLHLIEKAARALHATHEAGVVHRDIKPGNVMETPSGDAVILDFGIARHEEGDDLTITGDIMGTWDYMSPEQLTRGTLQLDRRTDVWSLGVTLYEILSLQRPFTGLTRQATLEAILTKDPPDICKLNATSRRAILD